MSEKWSALIQGGIGPDVWDKEFVFTAADFKDAASLASHEAETISGHVVELVRNDWGQGHAESISEAKRKFALAEDKLANTEKMLSDLYKAHDVVKLTLNGWKERAIKHEARVKELEGLAIGNERREDDGVWVEVFIPIERLGGADCEGEESPTLGDAMPRKDP